MKLFNLILSFLIGLGERGEINAHKDEPGGDPGKSSRILARLEAKKKERAAPGMRRKKEKVNQVLDSPAPSLHAKIRLRV